MEKPVPRFERSEMKRLLLFSVALVAATCVNANQSQAQVAGCGCQGFLSNSYYGYNYNDAGFERPPYFALFPPVYYSDQIVRRPMGVSPFAAPPGVRPVEMDVPPEPQHVVNPYIDQDPDAKTEGEPGNDKKMPIADTTRKET